LIVHYNQNRDFSALWSSGLMSDATRSVARRMNTSNGIGLLRLNSSMSGALSATGSGLT
jgi:hypothetical protein